MGINLNKDERLRLIRMEGRFCELHVRVPVCSNCVACYVEKLRDELTDQVRQRVKSEVEVMGVRADLEAERSRNGALIAELARSEQKLRDLSKLVERLEAEKAELAAKMSSVEKDLAKIVAQAGEVLAQQSTKSLHEAELKRLRISVGLTNLAVDVLKFRNQVMGGAA